MANQKHLNCIREKSILDFNKWVLQQRKRDSEFIIDLSEANLRGADLSGADLSEADLSGADLKRADLKEADLKEADLSKADLSGADLKRAKFSSRHQLNVLSWPLNNEQLLNCIILDEQNTDQVEFEEDAPALAIKFTRKNWRPIDIGLAFFSIELMANKLQYLCRKDISENDLERLVLSPCYPDSRNEGIELIALRAGLILAVFHCFLVTSKTVQD